MTGTKDIVKKETSRVVSPFAEMEKFFEDFWRRPSSLLGWPEMRVAEGFEISPSVDIYEEGNELVLKADLPGITKDEVEINITDNVLTLTGEKKKEEKVERENYFRYERSHGSFCRRFHLPDEIDTEKIKAHYKEGVLEVRLPKTEEAKQKTKKISIK
jgi:HSP20 family protein